MSQDSELLPAQKRWALAAAIPFLLSILLLGWSAANQKLLAFAICWPVLQVIGYVGSLKRAGGDTAHPLFKSQVLIHCIVVALLLAMLMRGS